MAALERWRTPSYDSLLSAAPEAEAVLADLGDFCRARSAPFVAGDAMATGVLIGRQEVFHRIARYLNLSEQEVWELMSNQRGEP